MNHNQNANIKSVLNKLCLPFLLWCILLPLNSYAVNNGQLSALSLITLTSATYTRPFYMGFTPWPWALSSEAEEQTYQFINQHADIISHHLEEGVPWDEALADLPFNPKMMESWALRKRMTGKHLKVFLSISPINQLRDGLAAYRGAEYHMPLSPAFKGRAFNDAMVKTAYSNYAQRAVEFFKPDYLAIAIEVNELWDNAPQSWNAFTELYRYTYFILKERYPQLPIFFTVSLHNIVNTSRGNPDITWGKIEDLWQDADIAAISFYPFLQYPFDLRDPISALDEVSKHTSKPVAISETGYPGKANIVKELRALPATPEIQRDVYFVLLNKAREENYKFLVLWAYRDYDILWQSMKDSLPEWGAIWRDVGLQDGQGKERPAMDIWTLFFTMRKR